MKNILQVHYIVLALVLTACNSINIKRETPKTGYDYPKFTYKDSLKGAPSVLRDCFDVSYYNIDFTIDFKKKSIAGYTEITAKATTDFNEFQLDLFENLKIDSIYIDNKKTTFTRKHTAVFIKTQQKKSNTFTTIVYYKGKPIIAPKPPWDGGFVWEKSKDKLPWVGVACELTGASLWYPCKDLIADEPEKGMSISISYPSNIPVKMVSNGIKTSESQIDGKLKTTWKTNYSINNYNITFYIGNFVNFSETYHGIKDTFLLDYYVLPQDEEKAKVAFLQTKEIIKVFEELFGPYPWSQENFKLVGSPYEGMEHQTAIAYGNSFKMHQLGFDYIILHETAHEWFGNSISVNDYSDIFIHEGFATYAEALFIEKYYGYKSYIDYMAVYGMFIKNKNPIVGPSKVNFWDFRDTDPYLKGAWVLHGLRSIMQNDSLFFAIIKDFYNTYAYKNVTVKDFTDFVNAKSNTDYTEYFNQYLYKREVPVLEYRFIEKNENLIMEMRWTNVDKDFNMPVKLYINKIPIVVDVNTSFQEFTFYQWTNFSFENNFTYNSLKEIK